MVDEPNGDKPKVLRIEGLSDMGKRVDAPKPEMFKDDFSDAVIAKAPAPEPKRRKVAPDHRKLAEEAKAEREKVSLSMLVRLGIEKDRPDPIPRPKVPLIPKGYRKIGEIDGKAILFPNAPWRRV